MAVVKVPCTVHGGDVEIEVPQEQLDEWLTNPSRHIQHVFPNLTPAERELFITGMCGTCWDKMFADPDCRD